MAPWTMRNITALLEKLTPSNIDERASKIVSCISTRDQVQQMAVLVGRRASRLYAQTFHLKFDEERRNLCDSFIESLVHHFEERRKPIRGVPLPGIGLDSTALIKADLLSVWISDHGKTGVGPVAAALYNARCLTLDDMCAAIASCLEPVYLASSKYKHCGDALLLLEMSAGELDNYDPTRLDGFISRFNTFLEDNAALADKQTNSGNRTHQSLRSRLDFLVKSRQLGWYRLASTQADINTEGDQKAVGDNSEENQLSIVNGKSATESEELSTYSNSELATHSRGTQTPPATNISPRSDLKTISAREEVRMRNTETLPHPLASLVHGECDEPSEGANSSEGDLEDDFNVDDSAARRAGSPWFAYFASVAHRDATPTGSRVRLQSQIKEEQWLAGLPHSQEAELGCQDDADGDSITSAAELAASQRRESNASNVKRRALPTIATHAASLSTDRGSRLLNDADACHVSFGQALQGGIEDAPPAGSSRVPSLRNRPRAHKTSLARDILQKPVAFDEQDAIWIDLGKTYNAQPSSVRVKFPPQFRLGDSRRLAHLFADAIQDMDDDSSATESAVERAVPLSLLPDGTIGQTLPFSTDGGEGDIFVEYAPTMTLAQMRVTTLRLTDSLAAYKRARFSAVSP